MICSPEARKSDYVNDEIRRWVKLKGPTGIIPILLQGVPNNEANDDQEVLKAFPPALYEEIHQNERGVPLAMSFVGIDVKKEKIPKGKFEGAWYRLLANIYERSREEIEQRDRRSQAKKRNVVLAIVSALALVLAGISIFAWIQMNEAQQLQLAEEAARQESEKQRAKAEAQKKEAEKQRDIAATNAALAKTRQLEAEAQKQEANRQKNLAVKNAEEAKRQAERVRAEAIQTGASAQLDKDPTLGILILTNLDSTRIPHGGLQTAFELQKKPVAQSVFQGHTGEVFQAAYSPDEKFIVTDLG